LLRDAFPSFASGGFLGAVAGLIVLVRPRREVFAFLLWSAVGLITFFLSVYSGFLRHAGFLWLATTAAVWLEEGDASRRVPRRSVLLLLFAFSALSHLKSGVNRSGLDYDALFERVRSRRLLRSLTRCGWWAHPATTGEAVLPYLPIASLYYPGLEAFGSYLPWNGAYVRGLVTTAPDAFLHTRARFPDPRPIVFITTKPIDDPAALGLTLRHRTAAPHDDFKQEEEYWIYTAGDVPIAGGAAR
jgi:hypothetical protein